MAAGGSAGGADGPDPWRVGDKPPIAVVGSGPAAFANLIAVTVELPTDYVAYTYISQAH